MNLFVDLLMAMVKLVQWIHFDEVHHLFFLKVIHQFHL